MFYFLLPVLTSKILKVLGLEGKVSSTDFYIVEEAFQTLTGMSLGVETARYPLCMVKLYGFCCLESKVNVGLLGHWG